jgi:ribosome recycling factor
LESTLKKELQDQLSGVVNHFKSESAKLRTGRAHPSMVEDVMAENYGVKMPLKALATITAPEPQLIQISPFDPSSISAIATAIRNDQALGLNPVDDGRVIRVQVPALTTERRQQIVKQLSEKLEEANIGMRQARHSAIDDVNAAKKDKEIGEDEAKRLQKMIDDVIAATKTELEQIASSKEAEILSL